MMNNITGASRLPAFGLIFATLICCSLTTLVSADTDAHHRDYDSAIHIALNSKMRIIEEMIKVRAGTVAHYDFVQFEHIELVRHAQALAFPPAATSATDKELIKVQADALLAQAQDLEWVIADYIRAFAQVRSATSNTLDILHHLPGQTKPSLSASLEAEIEKLIASQYNNDWNNIDQTFDALIASNIDTTSIKELEFQRQQLKQNLPKLEPLIQKVALSETNEIALRIRSIFDRQA